MWLHISRCYPLPLAPRSLNIPPYILGWSCPRRRRRKATRWSNGPSSLLMRPAPIRSLITAGYYYCSRYIYIYESSSIGYHRRGWSYSYTCILSLFPIPLYNSQQFFPFPHTTRFLSDYPTHDGTPSSFFLFVFWVPTFSGCCCWTSVRIFQLAIYDRKLVVCFEFSSATVCAYISYWNKNPFRLFIPTRTNDQPPACHQILSFTSSFLVRGQWSRIAHRISQSIKEERWMEEKKN